MNRKETATQRKRRLAKAKMKRLEKLANESYEHKQQRLEKRRLAATKLRTQESLEQRIIRLNKIKIRRQENRKKESLEQNALRKDKCRMTRLENKRNLIHATTPNESSEIKMTNVTGNIENNSCNDKVSEVFVVIKEEFGIKQQPETVGEYNYVLVKEECIDIEYGDANYDENYDDKYETKEVIEKDMDNKRIGFETEIKEEIEDNENDITIFLRPDGDYTKNSDMAGVESMNADNIDS